MCLGSHFLCLHGGSRPEFLRVLGTMKKKFRKKETESPRSASFSLCQGCPIKTPPAFSSCETPQHQCFQGLEKGREEGLASTCPAVDGFHGKSKDSGRKEEETLLSQSLFLIILIIAFHR